MKTRWLEKRVDFGELYDCVEEFFQKEGFNVSMTKSNREVLFLSTKKYNGKPLDIIVKVEGKPGDFSVEIKCRNVSESAYMYTHFLSLFGLGGLVAKKLELLDIYKALEGKFWAFMDDAVDRLAASSG